MSKWRGGRFCGRLATGCHTSAPVTQLHVHGGTSLMDSGDLVPGHVDRWFNIDRHRRSLRQETPISSSIGAHDPWLVHHRHRRFLLGELMNEQMPPEL